MSATASHPCVATGKRCDFVHRLLLCAFVSLWCISPANADWPHVRGPNYDGVSAERDLADAWPLEGPPRLWTRSLGQGYSGFVVGDGKLFTQRQSLGGQFLVCLDPDTGDTVWEHRYDWAWQPKGAYPGPYATPTYYRGKVFFASTSGIVGCVDAQTGAALWSVNVLKHFKGKGCGFGYAATPLVENDKVIVPAGGPNASLVALHGDDGRTVWAVGSDPASYCPAMPITLQNRRCVVGYLQNSMILVELATGKLLHRHGLSAGYDEHSAWPIYREPNLMLAAPFRVPAVRFELSMRPAHVIESKTTWISKEMCNDVVSSGLYEDHLYGFDLRQLQASAHRASRGNLKCLDWATGKLCWSTEEVGHASVLIADGKLLMLDDTGSVILARADPAGYRELARTQVFDQEICWSPPTLWRGKLFVRSPSQAVCLYVGRPERAPKIETPIALPTVRWRRIDPAWLLTREREFPNDAPSWQEMATWFGVCVLAFGGAALMAIAARRWTPFSGWVIFFLAALVLAFLGTNVFSSLLDRCLFTWPASLFAAFHAALWACWRAEQQADKRLARWLARLAVLVFLIVAYSYYELCKMVGMYVAWSFLIGFPFAFPFTFLAVRSERGWIVALWTLLAFVVFFWSAQGLLLWKAAQS